jgi:hypothetical protein
MKITFETNAGVFVAYLSFQGEIILYASDDDTPLAVIEPHWKRKPVFDLSADGVVSAARSWLEASVERLEIECITARLTPPGRAI